MALIAFNASLGWSGKSGVSTTAFPTKASCKAFAIGQLPVAKNPCKNSIFFMPKFLIPTIYEMLENAICRVSLFSDAEMREDIAKDFISGDGIARDFGKMEEDLA